MGGRSSLPPEISDRDEASGGYRLPVPGNRSSYHLALERLPAQPSPGPATGWRTSGGRSTPTYGVFRYRAREWLAAPQLGSLHSTRHESAAQYSPDGKRIAFESDRSGVHGIWVSDADGSNAEELFSQAGAGCGTARWSPDGQRIAFDFNPEGNIDIYVIRASGGKPMPLTTDSADDVAPSWSRDGKWVYFTSKRTGR